MKKINKKLYHNVIDLTGKTFNRISILRFSHSNRNGAYWFCKCRCGVKKVILGTEVYNGRTKSCGCFVKENNAKLGRKRIGIKSPRWNPDREYIFKKKKCLKFIYKQLQNILINKDKNHKHKILGYTSIELASHIEKQFDNKMSWNNYGTYWHIDHKRPISWFLKNNLNNPKIINALSNLRPLEAKENIRKGDKFVY